MAGLRGQHVVQHLVGLVRQEDAQWLAPEQLRAERVHVMMMGSGRLYGSSSKWISRSRSRAMKDKVENYRHQQVCGGAMTLAEARRIISGDWTQELGQVK